ncbi:MAG: DUF5131 family protein [Magnetospiraceae bacterium]
MGDQSKIQYTDHTFSPWYGCTKVGPGCDHCYAENVGRRLGVTWGGPRKLAADSTWKKPLVWNRIAAKAGVRKRVMVSLCDPFDNQVPSEWTARFFRLIDATPNLDWILVTKRIGNAAKWVDGQENIWLVATVCTQAEADRDIPRLLTIPAMVHGISIEPLLEPIRLRHLYFSEKTRASLNWVIIGGESGPKARRCEPEWFGEIIDLFEGMFPAVFVKQLGSVLAREWDMADPKGGDPDEWPEGLRVRELPWGLGR